MEAEVVSRLGAVKPPKPHGDAASNTLAINPVGLVLVLTFDGKLQYMFSRDSDAEPQDVPINNMNDFANCKYENVSFNLEGTVALVWSAKAVGVVEIPQSMSGSQLDVANYYTLAEDCFSGSNALTKVVKAAFHPLSPHHILVLCQSAAIYVVDLVHPATPTKIPLALEHSFVSFCYGPSMDWMAASVLLLEKSGDVYCLCPVLPERSVLSRATFEDMAAWVDEQKELRILTTDEQNREYIGAAKSYLLSAFDSAYLNIERDGLYANSAGQDVLTVGNSDIDGSKYHSSHLLQNASTFPESDENATIPTDYVTLDSLPALQGPLRVQGRKRANSPQTATDIAVPGSCNSLGDTDASPVVAIAYADGEIEILLVGDQSASMYSVNSIGPSWMSPTGNSEDVVYPSPTLLLVESITLNGMKIEGADSVDSAVRLKPDRWTMVADPVMSHCIHVSGSSQCASFLLSINWLAGALGEELSDSDAVAECKGEGAGMKHIAWGSVESTGPTSYPPSPSKPHGLPSAALNHASNVLEKTHCIPVFYPQLDAGDDSYGPGLLSGVVVTYDPLLGHLALLRVASEVGLVAAVNMTIHVKLCELQQSLDARSSSSSGGVSMDLQMSAKQQNAHEKAVAKLFESALTGLATIPAPTEDFIAPTDATSSTTATTHTLIAASDHLKKTVLLPFNELQQRLKYRLETVKDTYTAQMELLKGTASAADAEKVNGDGIAINSSLDGLKSKHSDMALRVQGIQEKYEEQRERAEHLLNLIAVLRTKVSPAEKRYQEQLKKWTKEAHRLDNAIAGLSRSVKQTSETASQAASLPPTPTPNATPSSTPTTAPRTGRFAPPHPSTPDVSITSVGDASTGKLGYKWTPRSGRISQSPGGLFSRTPQSQRKGTGPYGYSMDSISARLGGMSLAEGASAGPTTTISGGNVYTASPAPSSGLKHRGGSILSRYSPSPAKPGLLGASMTGASGAPDSTPVKGMDAAGTPLTPFARNASAGTAGASAATPGSKQQATPLPAPPQSSLTDQDYELCSKLQSAQAEMIDLAKKEVVSLEKRLHALRKVLP